MNKKVTIIIPMYNCEKHIGECLDSLSKQKYKDFEVVLVDDGSTDKTISICSKYSDYLLVKKTNGGPGSARNLGLKLAKGDYLVFVDSDDILSENYLFELVELMKDCDLGIVQYTNILNKLDSVKLGTDRSYERYDMIDIFFRDNSIEGYLWNKIFKRKIIIDNDIVFNEQSTIWEDMLFVLEYLNQIYKVNISNKILYFYRPNMESLTHKNNKKSYYSRLLIIKKICDFKFSKDIDFKVRRLYVETLKSYLCNCSNDDDVFLDDCLKKYDIIKKDIKISIKSRILISFFRLFR